jgi:hypothetical protein
MYILLELFSVLDFYHKYKVENLAKSFLLYKY